MGSAKGEVNEGLIKSILANAGQRTASVSREYTVLGRMRGSRILKRRSGGSAGGLRKERLEAMRSAVILAGGSSSRLGTDKSLLEFDGKPLICWAVEKYAIGSR